MNRTTTTRPIRTVYDVRREKQAADDAREYRARVRDLRAKVRHWEAKVRRYEGAVHVATLQRFRAELADLTGGAA